MKVLIMGLRSAGKTTLVKHVLEGKEWDEIKKEPVCFWGLIAKRWQWTLLLGILLILFIVIYIINFCY